ncbi:sensor histidine kinase [Actinomadura kijaniata]|uniref:sensor histidine kinase n=1 Tax=Actinomadura kijaniata TaxID=46161 RepID=UPI000833CAEB|nr:sensor histidine kinase [Actinomadura kijaniata]
MNDAFTHRVLSYRGMDEFLGAAVPFLSGGVAEGDHVVAVAKLANRTLLQEALGDAAEKVEFVDAVEWYDHPARRLADCLTDAERAQREGRRLRVLGDPGEWARRDPAEVVEWQRIEALSNVALRGTGAFVLCPYARSLPSGVVAAGRRTHPETVAGAANPSYVDPWEFSRRCDSGPLPEPPEDAEVMPIETPDLYWLRMYVGYHAKAWGMPEDDVQRLLVAVTEVMTNAVRHGKPPYELRMWVDGGDVVTEVTDGGRWADGASFGLLPPRPAGRFGLWAVRLLCSALQIRTGDDGSTVRLRLRLPAVPAVPVNTG